MGLHRPQVTAALPTGAIADDQKLDFAPRSERFRFKPWGTGFLAVSGVQLRQPFRESPRKPLESLGREIHDFAGPFVFKDLTPSLSPFPFLERGSFGRNRHCEEQSDEAIQRS